MLAPLIRDTDARQTQMSAHVAAAPVIISTTGAIGRATATAQALANSTTSATATCVAA
jgi:hypothetical protein